MWRRAPTGAGSRSTWVDSEPLKPKLPKGLKYSRFSSLNFHYRKSGNRRPSRVLHLGLSFGVVRGIPINRPIERCHRNPMFKRC